MTERVRQLVYFIKASPWTTVGLASVFAVQFICFYWWASSSYYFSGDCLFYFSRQITSYRELWTRLIHVDELYQYRPLPYVFFSFVLYPLFGAAPSPYHAFSYVMSLINILLVCGCCYFWLSRDLKAALIASVFLLLNPINFFLSYGLAYLDMFLAAFFYFLALILILADVKHAPILAPVLTVLALLSKEHCVLLPAHASMILLATGLSMRQTLSRTRNVWLVLAAYTIFQLVMRQGAVFAPETASSNLKFEFSLARLELLIKGIKPAIYFPESTYLNDYLGHHRRLIRLAFVYPWIGMIVWSAYRRHKIALSGLLWAPIALLPVAFIRFPPFPRHYYFALPGVAILFVSVVRNTRVAACLAAIFALVTITSVSMYANTSWIVEGSSQTKKYFREIEAITARTGRTSFYVLSEGDPNFRWHIDSGVPLNEFMTENVSFRFAADSTPLPMEPVLSNSFNIIRATWAGIDVVPLGDGRFPRIRDSDLCGPIRTLMGSEGDCAIYFRGVPLEEGDTPLGEPPNGKPIFARGDEALLRSRTTAFLGGSTGIKVNAILTASKESADGVSVQVYRVLNGTFINVFEQNIRPGETVHLKKVLSALSPSIFVLRIGPGPNGNELGDWVAWRTAPS